MSWPLTLTISLTLGLLFLLTIPPPATPPSISTPASTSLPSGSLTPPPANHPHTPTVTPPATRQSSSFMLDSDDFSSEDDFNALSSPSRPPIAGFATAHPKPPSPPPSPGPFHLVTRVIDGDTIKLQSGETVRLIGIDTPESVHPRQPVACFGREASAFTRNLLLNQHVQLEPDITDRDRYGRLLRYVYHDGRFINHYLVAQGYATSYPYPPDIKYQQQLNQAQQQARQDQRGLWNACQHSSPAPLASSNPADPACRIKGNINSTKEKIYHLPDCPYYSRTTINSARGERYFCSPAEAENAGWRRARNCP